MQTDEQPIVSLYDLAALVGMKHARKLMQGLHDEGEAQKVVEEQDFQKMGRLDQAVDHFYNEECDGSVDMLIPPGAYVYWWLQSQKRGGAVGDFWRDEESVKWFKKKNPGVVVRNVRRVQQSGYNGLMEGTKYGDVRREAAAA